MTTFWITAPISVSFETEKKSNYLFNFFIDRRKMISRKNESELISDDAINKTGGRFNKEGVGVINPFMIVILH